MSQTFDDIDTLGCVRVSKLDQATEMKTSLEDQRKGIIAKAESLGRVLRPGYIFEDRESGGTAEGRPGFMALVAYCRTHSRRSEPPGVALFFNDSRFGRFDDPDEAAYWRFILAQCGWQVRFAENDDTDNLTARHVLRAIGSAQASEYRQQIKNNALRGARGAAAHGLWQTEAPFGYRRLAFGGGRQDEILDIGVRKATDQQVRLTPGPESEVVTLRWIFESYSHGTESLSSLASKLRTRAPRLKWSKQSVGRLLRNRVYLGEVIWCRRPHDSAERATRRVRSASDWVIRVDAHPPLIALDLFMSVQQRLATNRKRTRATRSGYPLSGLVTCAQCGSPFVGGGGRRGPDDDPDRYRFYKCRGGTSDPPVCPGPVATISKRLLEPLVVNEVAKRVSDPAVQALIAEEITRQVTAATHTLQSDEAEIRTEQRDLRRRIDNLVQAVATGAVLPTEAAPHLQPLREALAVSERRLAGCARTRLAADELCSEQNHLISLASDFKARAAELEGPELRELLAPWLHSAIFDKEQRLLHVRVRAVPTHSAVPGATTTLLSPTTFRLDHPLSPFTRARTFAA